MSIINTYLQRFYQTAQRRNPEVLYQGDGLGCQIALTFDDGPHPQDTPRLLEVLEKHKVRATFHLVGQSVEHHPDLVVQIHRSGHQPALHCYRHLPFPLEKPVNLRADLERSQKAIARCAGVAPGTIRDLRPPYGIFSDRNLSQLTEWGFRLVMWSCMPPHWMQPFSWSVRQVLEGTVPGAVIVLHDGHGHGSRVAEIVDAVVPQIRSMGFEFVTLEEMQAGRRQVTLSKQNQSTV